MFVWLEKLSWSTFIETQLFHCFFSQMNIQISPDHAFLDLDCSLVRALSLSFFVCLSAYLCDKILSTWPRSSLFLVVIFSSSHMHVCRSDCSISFETRRGEKKGEEGRVSERRRRRRKKHEHWRVMTVIVVYAYACSMTLASRRKRLCTVGERWHWRK